MKSIKRIAVTGAGGHIAYSLLFRIAAGEMLGYDQPVALHLLDVDVGLMRGVVMELEDCAYPLLQSVVVGTDPLLVFQDVDYAILLGAKPRGAGMERKDLLEDNGKIFVAQGQALNAVASDQVLVFVVGNPCNTNCLIALSHAPRLSQRQFFSMMRLDQNRSVAQLAQKAEVPVDAISCMAVWGNHAATQVPDFTHVKIQGKSALTCIPDRLWFEEQFIPTIQKRGAAVIAARGKSSAASAAHAVLESIRSLIVPTPVGDWFSVGLSSDRNPYGIEEGLIFSFPCRSQGAGYVEIVGGLSWDPFIREKMTLTEKELVEERRCVLHLLGGHRGR